jgi:hypothetical protein
MPSPRGCSSAREGKLASNHKFLVQLLEKVDSRHLFALTWIGISGVFVLMIYLNYRKSTRRNFRSDLGAPKVRIDTRQLPRRSDLPQKQDTSLRGPKA